MSALEKDKMDVARGRRLQVCGMSILLMAVMIIVNIGGASRLLQHNSTESFHLPPPDGRQPRELSQDNSWPTPRTTTTSSMAVLILSARSHVESRQAIRETWANEHDNVYFVVGDRCPIMKSRRKNKFACEPISNASQLDDLHEQWYAKRMNHEDALLREEQEHYRDMVWIQSPEAYHQLTHKVKEGFAWVIQHLPVSVQWIFKTDDDVVVRLAALEKYLQTFNATKSTVVGSIVNKTVVRRQGKWKEDMYAKHSYPPYARGLGYAVSRPVAEYIASHKESLVEYTSEDASVGIWIDESPLETEFVSATSFHDSPGDCRNPNKLISGHSYNDEKIMLCWQ